MYVFKNFRNGREVTAFLNTNNIPQETIVFISKDTHSREYNLIYNSNEEV